MLKGFRAKHPDIKVNVQTVPWQKMDTQVIQAAAAGKSPDVAQLSTYGLPLHISAGSLKPLNDYVGKNWTKEQKEDWVLPPENCEYDGQQMAYYWNSSLQNLFWYRKDLLTKKGLSVPKSWDELAEVAKALTTDRVAGYLLGLHRDGNAVQFTAWFIPALWSAGTELLDDKGRIAFNNERGELVFQWLFDMVHKHRAIPTNMVSITRDNMLDGFKAGTVATTTLASNVVSTARAAKETGPQLGLAQHPSYDPARPMPAFATGKFLVMGKDTKEPEAAALFMEYILSPEAQLINAQIANELPSRKSVLKDPWFETPQAADMKIALEYMAAHPHPFRYHEKNNQLADILAQEAQQIIANRKPIRDALDAIEQRWNRVLKGQ